MRLKCDLNLEQPELLIKRDDLTGLGFGGNKVRKLEFILPEALRAGADTLLTVGAAQSNHCRQTAAAAAALGLNCSLLLLGSPPSEVDGNILLDQLLGAEIRWSPWEERDQNLQQFQRELEAQGKKVFLIPFGGSSPYGALAYAAMMFEVREQLGNKFDRLSAVIFATGSGGTQAGLMLGAKLSGFSGKIQGISVLRPAAEADSYKSHIAALATQSAQLLASSYSFSPEEVNVDFSFLGEGYGIVGELERTAISVAARSAGLFLDPVYTGRAFGGMLSLIQQGHYGSGDTVLFLHTGGTPALFAYRKQVL